jgi:hypothetical protein
VLIVLRELEYYHVEHFQHTLLSGTHSINFDSVHRPTLRITTHEYNPRLHCYLRVAGESDLYLENIRPTTVTRVGTQVQTYLLTVGPYLCDLRAMQAIQ